MYLFKMQRKNILSRIYIKDYNINNNYLNNFFLICIKYEQGLIVFVSTFLSRSMYTSYVIFKYKTNRARPSTKLANFVLFNRSFILHNL